MTSPIALFVYNRPDHAERVIQTLMRAEGFTTERLHVFCDGPKGNDDLSSVEKTRQVVRKHVPGAKIIEQETNQGLACSIIGGVSALCDQFGAVIVIEDDLILAPKALRFLEQGLTQYRSDPKVMHVSAYMFPVPKKVPPAFFYREATCWGWATWDRAWAHFEPDPAVIQDFVRSRNLVSQFNINDTMFFWQMLEKQRLGEIDSWAIRWYGSMFMQGGLALHPGQSLVQNGGFDGTGVHCSVTDRFEVELADQLPELPDRVEESTTAVKAMMAYRNKTAPQSPVRKLLQRLRATVGV